MALKREYEGQELCSVAATLELVGDRWTWLIVRDAFLGMKRFAEFRASLGIAPNVLADRLRRLVDEDILERVPYGEHSERFEYVLTAKEPICSWRSMRSGSGVTATCVPSRCASSSDATMRRL